MKLLSQWAEMPRGVSGVYAIITSARQMYIGSAADMRGRLCQHASDLRRNAHGNRYLQNSWNKHGLGVFSFFVIEEVCVENLLMREQYYLDTVPGLCNHALIAGSPMKGRHHSESTKQRISEQFKGNQYAKGYKHTEEAKAKISQRSKQPRGHYPISRTWSQEAKDRNRGKWKGRKLSDAHKESIRLSWKTKRKDWHHSEETKQKIAEGNRGKTVSDSHKEILRQRMTGRVVSQETRDKLRQANLGKKASEETKAKISASSQNRKLSPSHKAALAAANLGKEKSPETRAKISQTLRNKKLSEEAILCNIL